MLLSLPVITVVKADGISIVGPEVLAPGATATYTVYFSSNEPAYFQYSVTTQNGSGSASGMDPNEGVGTGFSIDVNVTAGPSGTTTIYADVTIATTGSNPTERSYAQSKNITIRKNNSGGTGSEGTGSEGAGNGNSGSGNSGSGNSGSGGSSNSGNSATPDEEKTPEQLAEEKAAEEAKAKEDAQKNPLISSFNIISNNEKKFGETLSDIPTAVDTWEYEYKLPKRIDSVLLDVKSVSETTTLTFDKEQKFAEGEKTKDIVIRAVDGEITQEYKLKLTLDDSEPVKVNVGDKTATLYDDEALDKLMTEYGFTKEAIDQNGTASFAYQKDAMKLQLLTDEKQNAQWLALDKTNAAKTVVYPVLQDEGKMYLLTAPNPEMAKQTYGGVAVTPKDLDFKKFEGVDSSLKFDKQVSVWDLEGESGMIVNGMQTTDSEPRLYHIDNTQKLTPAFVAFDVASSKTTKVWAITATVVAVALAAGFGAYLYVNRAPKKRKDVNI